jgi:rRNA maturation RNase YbeY
MIRFETIDVMTPVLDYDHVRDWIVGVAAGCGYGVGELYYYFCSDEALLDINQRRLGHDFYTDIVTFPLTDSGDVISSEFCISLDRIAENCLNFGRSFESELLRVIIHGVLHLIGYDDHTDEERSRMREKEEECLRQFYK